MIRSGTRRRVLASWGYEQETQSLSPNKRDSPWESMTGPDLVLYSDAPDPSYAGSDPHMEGSGPSNPYGFEGPRAVWSVWETMVVRDSTH